MPAGEIAERLGIGATNLSFHLKELDRAGLLHSTREGRFIRYAIHVDGMRELLTYLTEQCCRGRPELCGETFRSVSNPFRPAGKPTSKKRVRAG